MNTSFIKKTNRCHPEKSEVTPAPLDCPYQRNTCKPFKMGILPDPIAVTVSVNGNKNKTYRRLLAVEKPKPDSSGSKEIHTKPMASHRVDTQGEGEKWI